MSHTYTQTNGIILIADPKILAVNTIDNHEPLIDLKHQQEFAYGPSPRSS